MASAFLSPPGSEFGPCAVPCEHRDCETSRHIAGSTCRICTEPIGYDRHYYQERGEGPSYVHAACRHDEVKAERKGASWPPSTC